jgi:hypothetical protein
MFPDGNRNWWRLAGSACAVAGRAIAAAAVAVAVSAIRVVFIIFMGLFSP